MCLDPEPSIEIYYNAVPIILIINVWGVLKWSKGPRGFDHQYAVVVSY